MLLLHLLLKELHGIGLDSFADGVNQFLGRKDLFEEGELEKKVVVSKMEITATDDKTYETSYYFSGCYYCIKSSSLIMKQ